jgi:hypothetical protein
MTSLPVDRPALRTFPKNIEAQDFNRVRLALARLAKPSRLSLPDHRGLDAILDDDCWLVVDSLKDDQPLLAWTAFKRPHAALHEPVTCELLLYHVHAGLIMGTALDALVAAVSRQSLSVRVTKE